MAGRGTDIQLGGNLEFKKKRNKNLKLKFKITKRKESSNGCRWIVCYGNERHESRRIDNQLRGRSGRQGDKGNQYFFLSLEDDLMRILDQKELTLFFKN